MKKPFFFLAFSQMIFISISVCGQSGISQQGQAYLENLLDTSILFDTSRIHEKRLESAGRDPLSDWKRWRTVENYFYGKNRGSLPMIADLQALHPFFRDKIAELIRLCKSAGIELAVVESYRTPAKQAQYYAMGRKYTSSSGGRSRHQYGLAVDVVPIVDSVATWNSSRLWRKIGLTGERLGLRWGGRWRVTYDPGHFEWSGSLSKRDLEEGYWPRIPDSFADQYPTIGQDLEQLQKNWEAWGVEQSAIANSRGLKGEEVVGVGN